MALVLPIDVAKVFNPNLDISTVDLSPFIEAADLLVVEELTGRGMSNDRLKQIELYVAAHFVTVTLERGGLQIQQIGFGGPRDEYKGIEDSAVGLMSTRFGQQAVMLDTSGRLLAISKKSLTARFRVAPSPKQWSVNDTTTDNTDDTTGFNKESTSQ